LAGAVLLNGACSEIPADPDASDGSDICARRQVNFDAGDDGSTTCEIFFAQPCGLPKTAKPGVFCQFLTQDCIEMCGPGYITCYAAGSFCIDAGLVIDSDRNSEQGPTVVQCGQCGSGPGRRPAGLQAAFVALSKNAVGDYFAQAAHLEAASVHAFRILRRELVARGAPKDLIEAAKRAEADEVRHTRITTRIARAHGGKMPKVRVARQTKRSLEAMAIENVVEGCVRETFAALIAMWQAERATDAQIAAAMKEIAVDETRHAALAWSVAAWAEPQLDAAAQERVNTAKIKAISDLQNETSSEPHCDLVAGAGLPRAHDQQLLLTALARELGVPLAA
ncbi:MAG: ferritin-like domain-containing protein, partial [Polyangiaceae bacterium]